MTKTMDDLGLKPFVPSEPLPPISTGEGHLTDMRQMTKVEIDTREVVQEVARVTASGAYEKARKQADEARARRQRQPAPNPMTETMIMKLPK